MSGPPPRDPLGEILTGQSSTGDDDTDPDGLFPDGVWECGMVPPAWRGVGGHVDDPDVRARRGTVHRHRRQAVWMRRFGRAVAWVAVGVAAVLAAAVVLYLLLLTVFCGINPTELL